MSLGCRRVECCTGGLSSATCVVTSAGWPVRAHVKSIKSLFWRAFMTEHTHSEFFSTPPIESLPDDIRARLEDIQERSGFLPNIFVAMARRPDEFRAFFNYHDVLMDQSNSSLTKAEKELIVVATSALNDCHYCVIAHGAILRIRAKNPSSPIRCRLIFARRT